MAAPNKPEPVDPVLYLLFAGMIFFTMILIGVEHFFMQDAQVFQVIAGVLTGFTGAFFGRMKPGPSHSPGGDDNSVNVTAPPAPTTPPARPARPLAPIDTLDA
jgi:hypothetical protein